MFKEKKSETKLTLEEYQSAKKQRESQRFHFHIYPLPVLLTLLIPLIFFMIILAAYFFYVKTLPN